jgi:hypothetical protein
MDCVDSSTSLGDVSLALSPTVSLSGGDESGHGVNTGYAVKCELRAMLHWKIDSGYVCVGNSVHQRWHSGKDRFKYLLLLAFVRLWLECALLHSLRLALF